MDKLNYDLWREHFEIHCLCFSVLGHLVGTSQSTDANASKWKEHDGLFKMWIYGTISESLLDSVMKKKCTARELWLSIENLFRDNKEGRALQLENNLRTFTIGDLGIHDYCQKLKSISDLLSNIDSPVSERVLVMHMLNGLSEKFDNIINVIMHKSPVPTYNGAHSMLLMEESRLKKQVQVSPGQPHDSSSPNMLFASSTPSSDRQQRQPQQYNNNSNYGRGFRNNNNNRGGRSNRGRGRGRHNNNYWQQPPWYQQQMQPYAPVYPIWPPPYLYGPPTPSSMPLYLPQSMARPATYAPSPFAGVLGSSPYHAPSEAHSIQASPHSQLTQAFSTMSL